ncbi:outer membrane cobalamin receptor [Parabacteroides sp. PF5-5]|uniref:TonB-dependent receptor plug domain-containing protein n=1 Tax=unclassified Parabacteroides TaxID=2649774 RepID=UPI002473CB94|nr:MULTISPECIES: TonB-dependent receptor [unclassified Parabacteroides]MDH6304943.1 outer membrane cobalamin receptor [Parabacteroides sp. PH5-39]MDH6315971.1 outer membrane cobalamin receptor [Parabacteroides sp. PF5-13]MDH6319628.1 outer membrane cobalamin receptor [Parabacteroides sp. PH5-13]MDH6323359.1 outer membrane cobalamin receptor [Parabacteroides sp. PH5-8]MDH6327132.1 outer membrane cobalamin receptor [Parabacteroides sp. PH5-41]
MPDLLFYKKGLWLLVCLFPAVFSAAQQTDSITYRSLSNVEVVEKARPSVMREGAPIQLLDRSGMERLGLQDLSEAVRRFSGVTVKDYGGIGGLKTVSVRSLGAQHTAVSYDGVSITDAQSGQVDISRFTLDNVETVSLSIGQADYIFQTARMYASAGALNITTQTPQFDKKSYRLEGQVKAGSFGMFNPSLRYEQKLAKQYAASLQADWLRADGQYPYTFTNGEIVTEEKRKNSDIKSLRTELNLFADWETNGTLRLKGYWFDSRRGLPGSVVLYNDYHKERLRNRNGFVQGVYENRLSSKLSLKAQGKFDYSWTHYQDFHSKYIDGQQTDVYTQREYYASAALLYTPIRHLSFSLAEDVFVNTLDATTPKCLFPERLTSLTALAAQFKNERLTATASLLGTFITEEVENGEAADNRKRLSPAVSLSYKLLADQNLRIRASYKDIFRVPTFNDLYYDRIGNKDLDPEKATQYNLGLTWNGASDKLRLDYVSLTVDGYYNRVDDKIVALPTMFIWKMMNMGKVDIKGLDINVSARFTLPEGMFLRIDGSYTWQEAIDKTDKEAKTYKHQIPYTPEHSGTASVSWENPWVNVSWLLTAVGDRYSLPQNIEANLIEGYIEQQLSFNRTFTFGQSSLRLQAEIVNLGDVTYDVIRYYPMPGRSFRGSIKYIF